LLFNQLLFYHIYKKISNDPNLKDLEEVKELREIQECFQKITDMDFREIYKVNIIENIPNNEKAVKILNQVIKAIKLLRTEYIGHDLTGRFFHKLLPSEVRKVLAAFYTHPIAADLLAFLTIEFLTNRYRSSVAVQEQFWLLRIKEK